MLEKIKNWFKGLSGAQAESRAATAQDVDAHIAQVVKTLEFRDYRSVAQLRPGETRQDIPNAPCLFWIDVYVSPKGAGYVLNYELEQGGKKMRKSFNVGPEERSADWYEVKA